jgi:hypothetical protein
MNNSNSNIPVYLLFHLLIVCVFFIFYWKFVIWWYQILFFCLFFFLLLFANSYYCYHCVWCDHVWLLLFVIKSKWTMNTHTYIKKKKILLKFKCQKIINECPWIFNRSRLFELNWMLWVSFETYNVPLTRVLEELMTGRYARRFYYWNETIVYAWSFWHSTYFAMTQWFI